jgi:hypothetical protein
MTTITIKYPDGNTREYSKGISGSDIAKSISNGLLKDALGISLGQSTSILR